MFCLGSILNNTPTLIIAIALFIGILFFYLAGVRLGNYQKKYNPDAKAEGVSPSENY
jgi:hypothetical protein